MSSVFMFISIGVLVFSSLFASESSNIRPDAADKSNTVVRADNDQEPEGCAPGDAEACKADGGTWYPQTCTCK